MWAGLCGYLRIQEDWVHDYLQEYVFLWIHACPNYKEIPMFVIWEVRKDRNRPYFLMHYALYVSCEIEDYQLLF